MSFGRGVIRLAGFTAEGLEWSRERGMRVRAREGHRRIYPSKAGIKVRLSRRSGGRDSRLGASARRFASFEKESPRLLVDTVSGSSIRHLATGSRVLYPETSPHAVADLVKNSQ